MSRLAPRFEEVKALCEPLFCPITVGGGITSIAEIRRLIADGADKVSINSEALKRPEFITEASEKFGAQAVVISIDVRDGLVNGRKPEEWAQECEHRGAGEILLTCVERDGMMEGYDLDLIQSVSSSVSIPVVAAGGCGSYEHMHEALGAGAHAVASGAAFQFKEMTPKGAARHLKAEGIHTRI